MPNIPIENKESIQREKTALKRRVDPKARLILFITPKSNEKDNASKEYADPNKRPSIQVCKNSIRLTF
tara:strand:+ start:299 stop:502 length:204 start_codon:yes stop_codon:yes gene_type:complete